MEEKKDSSDKDVKIEDAKEDFNSGLRIEDKNAYQSLPEKAQKAVSKAYKTVKSDVRKHFDKVKISGKYTNEQLLDKITLREEIVDKEPLKVQNYKLIIGKKVLVKGEKTTSTAYTGRTTPVVYDTEYKYYGLGTETFATEDKTEKSLLAIGSQTIIEGYNTDIHATDKRIMLLNTHLGEYPALTTQNKIEVTYAADDSFRVFSIPTKDINSISINMQNKVSESSVIDKTLLYWLILIGFFIGFFGFIIGLSERNLIIIFISLISAIILIAVAVYLKSYTVREPEMNSSKVASVILSVFEPFYGEKAILVLNINTKVHSLKEIVEWVKRLQQRCKNVV